jgi:predicted secreted protein
MFMRKFKMVISFLLVVTISLQSVNAIAYEEDAVAFTQDIIEEYTGTKDVVSDLYEDGEFVAIADGKDTIVKIPEDPTDAIQLVGAYDEEETFSVNLPNEAQGTGEVSENGTVVYENEKGNSYIGVQAIYDDKGFEGVRSLITINDSNASSNYSFKFNLEEGTKLMTANEYFGDSNDNFSIQEVYIVNQENVIIGIIDKPWAYDANGKDISTYYKVHGNDELVQVVEFDEDDAFPIVADPSAWKIAKCVGSIAWVIGTTLFSASKLLNLKKYIAALGGLKQAAVLMLSCSTAAERLKYGGQALLQFASIITGVSSLKSNCFP